MRFPGVRLVEQTDQKFRRFRDCLNEKKTSDCNGRVFILEAYYLNIFLPEKPGTPLAL